MELIPQNEVFQDDKRNTKKMLLPTDGICIQCGAIFNAVYEDQCLICDDDEDEKDVVECTHKEYIRGKQSIDLRILLDFHMEDLKGICGVHGCSESGSRSKIVISIMKKLYPNLDKRINENLIRKMILRNRKRFRFWKDIEGAIRKAKKREKMPKISIVKEEETIELAQLIKHRRK